MRKFENENRQFGLLCGIDEVGRGPLAGPVYAAAVILPEDVDILYINDSKKLSEKKRDYYFEEIKKEFFQYIILFFNKAFFLEKI